MLRRFNLNLLKNYTKSSNFLKILTVRYSKKDEIPKNAIKEFIKGDEQREFGHVYDKKPFKVALEAGKPYVWCCCGKSNTQPFCDGTHRNKQLKITLKPVKFEVDESKDYWLCNCKHTSNRPFCDGTHKLPMIQEGGSTVKA